MATLDQIYSQLGSIYDPQVDLVRRKQAEIPGQVQAEEGALKAREADYYDNTIMGGARRRGMGFSGIPEGERARYGATEYLPALARVRQSGRDQATSLEEAILGINERRMGAAQQKYQFDTGLEESRRASAAAAGGGFAPTLGGGTQKTASPYDKVDKKGAAVAMEGLFRTGDPATIKRTIDAINASAAKGNVYDKFKLELLKQYQTNSPHAALISRALSYKPLSVGVARPNMRITF